MKNGHIEVEKSSGNIFADLGLPNAKEMYVKSLLSIMILDILEKRKLKQKDAAKILGVSQARISALHSGHKIRDFSIDMLMEFLTKLDQDVEIRVKNKPRSHATGEISVSM